ncbi:MAG: hypothetical protein ACRCSL_16520 [Microbacterium sp.]
MREPPAPDVAWLLWRAQVERDSGLEAVCRAAIAGDLDATRRVLAEAERRRNAPRYGGMRLTLAQEHPERPRRLSAPRGRRV